MFPTYEFFISYFKKTVIKMVSNSERILIKDCFQIQTNSLLMHLRRFVFVKLADFHCTRKSNSFINGISTWITLTLEIRNSRKEILLTEIDPKLFIISSNLAYTCSYTKVFQYITTYGGKFFEINLNIVIVHKI